MAAASVNRRVLIVSPHFPPINAADHQRVRTSLAFFQNFGWIPTVLAVKPEYVEGAILDPISEATLPPEIRIVRTEAVPFQLTRRIGLGSLAIRAYRALRRAGEQLLQRERYDAVFFSTTLFPVMALGPRWRKRHGVPYLLDFQDPWRNDYYERTGTRPPGGWLKYRFSTAQARWLEPRTVRRAAHIVSVSPAYVTMLRERYSDLPEDRFTVLPFGAAEKDFEFLRRTPVKQSIFSKSDQKLHWVYIGRGGDDMAFSLRSFFTALRTAVSREPLLRDRLRLHFVGTDYAPPDRARKTVEPIANDCGVGDMVQEQTSRIPYFEAMQCLLDADALLVFGSDDPRYTASKINPYIVAKKPLLAIFHERSSVVGLLRQTQAGTVVAFQNGEPVETVAQRVLEADWFPLCSRSLESSPPARCEVAPATDWAAFEPYTSQSMTQKLCQVFDQVVPQA